MFLNNAYNVINSGADYAYSLKNNNFINISKEKKLNMGKINISESELKSLIKKVIVRELKESIDTDRYEDVVFLQGEEADEALEILNNQGEDAAMDYLTQWHFPGEHMGSSELNHGSSDNTYERDGYIMSYNIPLNYIGLQYEFPGINESKHQDNKKRNKQKKFNKVMGEFGDGTLKTPNGDVVTDRKQALAIAYSESGLDESKQKLYNIVENVARRVITERLDKNGIDRVWGWDDTPREEDTNKEYTADDLTKCDIYQAEKVFGQGMNVYVQSGVGRPSSTVNLFCISKNNWDASMNIYTEGMTPEEYGFKNIIKWIKERNNGNEVKFYTLYKKTPYIIESTNLKHYTLTVKHDNGKVNLKTTASSEKEAKEKIMKAEGCPESAILSCKEVGNVIKEGVAINNPKIEKYVNQINELISQAFDSEGDPIGVVDPTSTWEEPYVYEPIIYKNGALKIVSYSNYKPNDKNIDIIRSRDMEFDGIPTLRLISRMYKKALRNKDKEPINTDI